MGISAGILLVLISLVHIIYGEKKQIPELKRLTSDSIMIGSLRVMIYQGGLLLFAVGVIQIISSLNLIELSGVSRFFLVGIVLLNFCTFLLTAIFVHKELLSITLPQIVIFLFIISLQFFAF